MPAFMFEKIAPPVHHAVHTVTVAVAKEPRGVIVTMIDRLTEARFRREAKAERKAQRSFTEADIKPA